MKFVENNLFYFDFIDSLCKGEIDSYNEHHPDKQIPENVLQHVAHILKEEYQNFQSSPPNVIRGILYNAVQFFIYTYDNHDLKIVEKNIKTYIATELKDFKQQQAKDSQHFNDLIAQTKDEIKKLNKHLTKPSLWERFKAIFTRGLKRKKNLLQQSINMLSSTISMLQHEEMGRDYSHQEKSEILLGAAQQIKTLGINKIANDAMSRIINKSSDKFIPSFSEFIERAKHKQAALENTLINTKDEETNPFSYEAHQFNEIIPQGVKIPPNQKARVEEYWQTNLGDIYRKKVTMKPVQDAEKLKSLQEQRTQNPFTEQEHAHFEAVGKSYKDGARDIPLKSALKKSTSAKKVAFEEAEPAPKEIENDGAHM